MSQKTLDTRGMLCPLPVIRTQDCVEKLTDGDLLVVACTDPGVIYDIPAWCKVNGHEIVDIQQGSEEIHITVKVAK